MNQKNEVIEEAEIVDNFNHEEAPEDTDWKAKALEFQGRAKRIETKNKKLSERMKSLEKPVEDATPQNKSNSQSGDLDKGDKALLVAYGIKSSDEIALAKSWLNRTGDEIDTMIEDDIFQAKLTKLRDAKAVLDATPTGKRGSSSTGRDTVDYWLAKDEMPPKEMGEKLRRDYVTAKAKKLGAGGGHFYNS